MNTSKSSILLLIDTASESIDRQLVKSLLDNPASRPVSAESFSVQVGEVRRLCETRLKNSSIARRNILGANRLMKRLDELDDRTMINQASYVGGTLSGSMFFDHASHFIGVFLVTSGISSHRRRGLKINLNRLPLQPTLIRQCALPSVPLGMRAKFFGKTEQAGVAEPALCAFQLLLDDR